VSPGVLRVLSWLAIGVAHYASSLALARRAELMRASRALISVVSYALLLGKEWVDPAHAWRPAP